MTEHPAAYPPTGGVLLAGGLARRMGGGDKPLVEVAGRTLLDHVIARLGPQVAGLVLNINGDPARFAAFHLAVAPDPIAGHPGPLAGVLAGMEHFAARGIGWIVTVAADTPFIPTDLVRRLHAARGQHPVAVACSGGRTQPTVALYATRLAGDLRASLLAGERKIDRWTARHGEGRAAWQDQPLDPFFNVNTPEDVALAEALAARA
ncbi:MAG: molybdenum cofactor guanylyltransferase MobA [Acetobacteraceae bacterium]|nr:molybdenum cofactor guanylyltransferase MobA [Acetobacteraceae bacterium]